MDFYSFDVRARAIPYDRKNPTPYREASNQLEAEFRATLEREYGMTDYPQGVREAVYSKAWADGFSSVAYHYGELAELAQVIIKASRD